MLIPPLIQRFLIWQKWCDKIAGGSINVIYDIPEDNQYGYAADTKLKLNSDKLCSLGWKPRIDLETSYRRLIEYIKETEC